MPKTLFDWKSKSRKVSYMCMICGKKYGTKQEAHTCEWADKHGATRHANGIKKQSKERRKENENNISDQLEGRSCKDNDFDQSVNIAGGSVGKTCSSDRQ